MIINYLPAYWLSTTPLFKGSLTFYPVIQSVSHSYSLTLRRDTIFLQSKAFINSELTIFEFDTIQKETNILSIYCFLQQILYSFLIYLLFTFLFLLPFFPFCFPLYLSFPPLSFRIFSPKIASQIVVGQFVKVNKTPTLPICVGSIASWLSPSVISANF